MDKSQVVCLWFCDLHWMCFKTSESAHKNNQKLICDITCHFRRLFRNLSLSSSFSTHCSFIPAARQAWNRHHWHFLNQRNIENWILVKTAVVWYLSVFELDVARLLLVAVIILHVTLVGHRPPEEGATRGAGLQRRLESFNETRQWRSSLMKDVECKVTTQFEMRPYLIAKGYPINVTGPKCRV